MAAEVRAPGQGRSFPKLLKAAITTLRRNCYRERAFEEYGLVLGAASGVVECGGWGGLSEGQLV